MAAPAMFSSQPLPKVQSTQPSLPGMGTLPHIRGSPRPLSPAPPLRQASLLTRLTAPCALVPAANRKTSPGITSVEIQEMPMM